MANQLLRALSSVVAYSYGLFNVFLYCVMAVKAGTFFKRPTERENLELRLGTFISVNPFGALNVAFFVIFVLYIITDTRRHPSPHGLRQHGYGATNR
jgi:hypothetical protein